MSWRVPQVGLSGMCELQVHSNVHRSVINPIIEAELWLTFSTVEALDQVLAVNDPNIYMPINSHRHPSSKADN